MKVSDISKSNYLKKEDCTPPITLTIDSVVEEEIPNPRTNKREPRWVMYFREVEKGVILNVTNGNLLQNITGSDDSQDWIGRKVTLWNNPEVINPQNPKDPGGIRFRAPGGSSNPRPRNHFAKELVENYSEPTVDQVNADLQEAAELNRRKHQPQAQPVEDDDENLPF
jgi:hypothetical protein